MMARLAQARADDLRVLVSAATLVEARDPRPDQGRFDWATSRLVVEPVAEALARATSRLLARHALPGHQHGQRSTCAIVSA